MLKENDFRKEVTLNVAKLMCSAARTAPKARGLDSLVIEIVDDENIKILSAKMEEIGTKTNQQFFIRDAGNVIDCNTLILVGTKIIPRELPYCGLCGHINCAEKKNYKDVPCAFNLTDLGIATGSAVSVAAHNHIDCRVIYTVGMAAKELEILGDDVKVIWGIPLSISSKNIFFDRK